MDYHSYRWTNHGIAISYNIHQCRPCILRIIYAKVGKGGKVSIKHILFSQDYTALLQVDINFRAINRTCPEVTEEFAMLYCSLTGGDTLEPSLCSSSLVGA